MKKLLVVTMLFASFLSGCGEKKEDSEASATAATEEAMEGTWLACLKEYDSKGNAISSLTSSFQFATDGTLHSIFQYYKDTSCTEVDGEAYESEGTYTVGEIDGKDFSALNLVYTGGNEDGTDSAWFTIVKVDGDKMYLGVESDELDGSTEEKRSQELDVENVWARQ
ncbi:hypothetical protein [Oligoflexus tunisiensis]|uniref:hypothetical protein n=1 Tax=Oligoflexus tunisiensis TaxID=708132 RepID=UPI00114CB291|nr:hypothetical protein [Oligoflexus tunisiensis]